MGGLYRVCAINLALQFVCVVKIELLIYVCLVPMANKITRVVPTGNETDIYFLTLWIVFSIVLRTINDIYCNMHSNVTPH